MRSRGMDEGLTLPIGQLREWAEELRRNAREIARLTAEREEILQKIHAARLLFGEDAVPEPPPEIKPGEQTFVSFIQSRLDEADNGLTLSELSAALKESPLREKFMNNPNAVYTAVGRLVEREKAFREGRLVYAPKAYARLKAGEITNRNANLSELTVQDMILAVVGEAGKGLTSGEILDAIRNKDAGQAARFDVRPQIGYNAISRLARKGKLRRDGKFYRLPEADPNRGPDGWADANLFGRSSG